jgi:hypothetical protein
MATSRARVLTLRGVLDPFSAEIPLDPQEIFAYESAGQTRAWKVTRLQLWPSDFGDGEIWTYQTFPVAKFVLSTDTGDSATNLNADENRSIGWFHITHEVGKDQLNISPVHEWWDLDPDHLVTGRLYIAADMLVHPADNDRVSQWSYLVTLEPRTVSSAESILQTLKGRGQDVAE